jgi:hypothetical protein
VVGALVEGCSIRTVERTTEIHRDMTMSLGVRVGEACGPLPEAKSPLFWVMSNLRKLSVGSVAALHCRVVAQRSNLQSSGEEQDDQDKENDSADSNSTTRTKGVVAAATAEQQKQDQNE